MLLCIKEIAIISKIELDNKSPKTGLLLLICEMAIFNTPG